MAQLKDFQTGAVGDSFNGPVGSSTAAAGAFTTLSASSTLGVTGVATLGAGAILNTPASVTLTNATGLPIATGVSGLGTGVATFLATPSSANLRSALTDETGTGSAVFATSPTLVTPVLGAATGTSFQGIIGNVTPAAGAFTTVTATGSGTLTNLLLSGGTLPAAGNPSIALRSSDNVIYHQAGSANQIAFLDSAQNSMYVATATSHSFAISNAEKISINSAGNLKTAATISVGNATPSTSGAGITFPATLDPSSDANTLDDYEEGTFNGGSITGVNLTGLSLNYGYYTKIGRLVTLNFSINATVTTSNTLTYVALSAPFAASVGTAGSGFLNNNVRDGFVQITSTTTYVFFPAASEPVAGSEIIIASVTYTF
jgi:hypothetical protein